jgi:DNA-directed RNA polymerase subunit omega
MWQVSAATSRARYQLFTVRESTNRQPLTLSLYLLRMKASLISAASAVVPNQQILVNMVSRRVRQLTLGHRPLVEVPPGTQSADIALTEIIQGKLTFESTFVPKGQEERAQVIPFPGTDVSKKKAA